MTTACTLATPTSGPEELQFAAQAPRTIPLHPNETPELRALIKDWEKDKKPAAWPTARDVTWDVCGKVFTVPV